jgi:hypothetical protein
MSAALTPVRVYGSTTPRTISQRVAPSASAPSSSSVGTLMKSSLQMLEQIGTTMIVKTRIAIRIPEFSGELSKNGTKPRCR